MNSVAERVERAIASSGLADATVAVLRGGRSSEREVSLVTAAEVDRALAGGDRRGPRAALSIEIDELGAWRLDGVRRAAHEALAALDDVDVFFLALHGGEGENGTLQGFLQAQARRFTGSSAQASAICMDKLATRGLARELGLEVAGARCVDRATWRAIGRARSPELAPRSRDGWAVKPRCGGSSVATFVVDEPGGLGAAIEGVLETGDDALIEARVVGVEVSCGVLDGIDADPLALPPIEIRPRAERFFDYREKYAPDGAIELCPAPSLDHASIERVRLAAATLHAGARCTGYSRSDFIVRDDGVPVLLEINTLPGLTPRSLLPKEAAAVGLDYGTLVRHLCANGLATVR